jgi:hypothetical protein
MQHPVAARGRSRGSPALSTRLRRYFILLPLRLVGLLVCNALIVLLLSLVYLVVPRGRTRKIMEQRLAQVGSALKTMLEGSGRACHRPWIYVGGGGRV